MDICSKNIMKEKNGSTVIEKAFSYAPVDLSRMQMGYANEEELAMISFVILQVSYKHETKSTFSFHSR